MRKLAYNKKCYLMSAYEKGYRYIATDLNCRTYFYKDKPTKTGKEWVVKVFKLYDIF